MRHIVIIILAAATVVGLARHVRQRKEEYIAREVRRMASSNHKVADEARSRLQRCGVSAVRPVAALLDDPSPAVRERAARCLANIGHAAAARSLFQHARAGEEPAAQAFAALKHPRTREALAWPKAVKGAQLLEELQHRLPAGGDKLAPEPGRHEAGDCSGSDMVGWYAYQSAESVRAALRYHPLTDALTTMARLHELCGDYDEARALYAELLTDQPRSADARDGKQRTERLLGLAKQMQASLPLAYRVRRIFEHDAWKTPTGTYRVALISYPHGSLFFSTMWPKLVAYRFADGKATKLDSVAPMGWGRQSSPVWVGLASASREPQPLIVVATGLFSYGDQDTRLQLYRLSEGQLERVGYNSSYRRPTVSDLDHDGRLDIVTWSPARADEWG
jgi:hypothetical protein